jgi:hypothetical protein
LLLPSQKTESTLCVPITNLTAEWTIIAVNLNKVCSEHGVDFKQVMGLKVCSNLIVRTIFLSPRATDFSRFQLEHTIKSRERYQFIHVPKTSPESYPPSKLTLGPEAIQSLKSLFFFFFLFFPKNSHLCTVSIATTSTSLFKSRTMHIKKKKPTEAEQPVEIEPPIELESDAIPEQPILTLESVSGFHHLSLVLLSLLQQIISILSADYWIFEIVSKSEMAEPKFDSVHHGRLFGARPLSP